MADEIEKAKSDLPQIASGMNEITQSASKASIEVNKLAQAVERLASTKGMTESSVRGFSQYYSSPAGSPLNNPSADVTTTPDDPFKGVKDKLLQYKVGLKAVDEIVAQLSNTPGLSEANINPEKIRIQQMAQLGGYQQVVIPSDKGTQTYALNAQGDISTKALLTEQYQATIQAQREEATAAKALAKAQEEAAILEREHAELLAKADSLPGAQQRNTALQGMGFQPTDLKSISYDPTTQHTTYNYEGMNQEMGVMQRSSIVMNQYNDILKNTQDRHNSFGESMLRDVGKVAQWGLAVQLLYQPMYKLSELFQVMIDNEQHLATVMTAMSGGSVDASEVFSSAAKAANELGANINDVLDGYAAAYRATGNIADQNERFKVTNTFLAESLTLEKLSTLDSAQAIDVLSAALKQMNVPLDEGQQVLDQWVATTKIANVTVDTLAQSFAIAGEAANDAGITTQQFSGYVAVLSELTTKSPEETGNLFKSILSGFQSNKGQSALQALGIATTDFQTGQDRPVLDLMNEVSQRINSGSIDKEQANTLGMAIGGGSRRGADTVAFLSNLQRAQDITNQSMNNSGAAEEAVSIRTETLQTAITRLGNAFQTLANTAGSDGGFISIMKSVIDLATGVVSGVDGMTSSLGKLTPILIAAVTAAGYLGTRQPGQLSSMLGGFGVTEANAGGIGNTFKNASLYGGAGIIAGGQLLGNLGAGNADAATGNAVGALIGGAIGTALGGPVGTSAGIVIGSSIADSFVKNLIQRKAEISELTNRTPQTQQQIDAQAKTIDPKQALLDEAMKLVPGGQFGANMASGMSQITQPVNNWLGKTFGFNLDAGNKGSGQLPGMSSSDVARYYYDQTYGQGAFDRELSSKTASRDFHNQESSVPASTAPKPFDTLMGNVQNTYTAQLDTERQKIRDEIVNDLVTGQSTSAEYKSRVGNNTNLNATASQLYSVLNGNASASADEFSKSIDTMAEVLVRASPEMVDVLTQLEQQYQDAFNSGNTAEADKARDAVKKFFDQMKLAVSTNLPWDSSSKNTAAQLDQASAMEKLYYSKVLEPSGYKEDVTKEIVTTSDGRAKVIEGHLKVFQYLLGLISDGVNKTNGVYNLPTGGQFMVPFNGYNAGFPGGGGGDKTTIDKIAALLGVDINGKPLGALQNMLQQYLGIGSSGATTDTNTVPSTGSIHQGHGATSTSTSTSAYHRYTMDNADEKAALGIGSKKPWENTSVSGVIPNDYTNTNIPSFKQNLNINIDQKTQLTLDGMVLSTLVRNIMKTLMLSTERTSSTISLNIL